MTDQPTTVTRQPIADAIECAIGLNINCGGTAGVHRVRDAVLTAIEQHLDTSDEQAWCKVCRRVWDGPRHRCESDAEQRLDRVRALRDDLRQITGARYIADALDTILNGRPTATEATGPAAWLLAGTRDLNIPPAVPCPACRRADQAGLAPAEQHDDCAKEQR